MFAGLDQIRQYCEISAIEERELTAPAAPIVVVRRKPSSGLSRLASPDTDDLGVFLPYAPLHHLLLAEASPLIMTSGNLAEEPIVKDDQELRVILGPVADAALIHNRAIVRRSDDSVLKIVAGQRLFLRRSRGFVPYPIVLLKEGPPILACGADQKNTFCMTRGDKAYLSQYIGDMVEYTSHLFYGESVNDLMKLLGIDPAIVACDMHPDYHSTRYAHALGKRSVVPVQHHHAHIASCMAENRIQGPVIGIAFDENGVEVVPPFIKKTGINYSVYLGGGDIAEAHDLQAYPTTVIYGKDSKVANKHIGFVSEKEFDDEIGILLKR